MDTSTPHLSTTPGEEACNDLVARWQRGERVPVEAYLLRQRSLSDPALVFEMILTEVVLRQEVGDKPQLDEYLWRFPEHAERLGRHFALHAALPTATLLLNGQLPAPRPTPSQADIPGYEILDEVGAGAMGVVYRARQTSLNRLVALKVIVAGRLGAGEQERFRIEAEALARLQHPHIVQIYDVGVHEGRPYLVCELVEGGTLAEHLDHQPLAARDAAALVATLAEAMQHAHARDIIHRDLKPANILLADDGGAKIADFGLAKLLDRTVVATRSGDIVGTPAYMAPEQAAANRDAVGVPADVYSLGAILYETLTGRAPFCAESPLATLLLVTQEEPLPPRRLRADVPRDLEIIALKCLEKDVRRRYPTALALADDLGRWLRGEPIHARAVGPWERGWRWAARHPLLAALSFLTLLAVVLSLVTLSVSTARISREQRETARVLQQESQARATLAEERTLEQQQSYLERVALAQRMWLANQTPRARALLDLCPPHLRQWEWYYLDNLRHANLRTIDGLGQEVTKLAYSRDGRLLAAALHDGTVKLLDAESGQELALLCDRPEIVTNLRFSPDNTQLAVSNAHALTVWDVKTRKPGPRLPGDFWSAFSPNGALLASSHNRDLKLWDARTFQELHSWPGHNLNVLCGAFTPDGKTLATGSADLTVRLWDVATQAPVAPPRQRMNPIYHLAYSPDGAHLYEFVNGNIRRTEAKTGTLVRQLDVPPRAPSNFDLGTDGRWIAHTAPDFSVKVWDVTTHREAFVFRGHTYSVRAVALDPTRPRLASAGGDQTIRFWDLSKQHDMEVIGRFPGQTTGLAFSPDGRLLARAFYLGGNPGAGEDEVLLLDATTKRRLHRLAGRNDALFSRDGRELYTAAEQPGAVLVWDVATGRLERTLDGPGDVCRRLALSGDGRQLAALGTDNTLRLWDLTTKNPGRVLVRGSVLQMGLAFHPRAALVATGDQAGQVSLWDVATGRPRWTAQHFPGVDALAFSPDGTLLASGGSEGVIKVWDATTGRLVVALHGHTWFISDLLFHQNNRRLASLGADRAVRLWDVASGQELLSLPTDLGPYGRLAFSPDGRRLVAGAPSLHIWTAPLPE